MIEILRKRRHDNEEGFTLIELMVVVLIIAILLAIAIPTFLGARDRANDRAAQSSLRNGLTAAKVVFTDKQDYTQATVSTLTAEEPSLVFQTGASTTFKQVSFNTPAGGTTFGAAAKSKSGKCFYIKDVAAAPGGTTYGTGPSTATCDGTTALTAATATEW